MRSNGYNSRLIRRGLVESSILFNTGSDLAYRFYLERKQSSEYPECFYSHASVNPRVEEFLQSGGYEELRDYGINEFRVSSFIRRRETMHKTRRIVLNVQ